MIRSTRSLQDQIASPSLSAPSALSTVNPLSSPVVPKNANDASAPVIPKITKEHLRSLSNCHYTPAPEAPLDTFDQLRSLELT